MRRFFSLLCLLGVAVTGLAACDSMELYREESVRRIAAPVFLLPRTVTAEPFTFQVYERVYERGAPAMLYIEGDGDTDLTIGDDPGPRDPVALRLAAQDGKTNVIYIARACQYVGEADECPEDYWKGRKYSPEVIEAMSRALSKIAAYNEINGYHLVGYEGGAAVAVALADRRDDVLSLRSVAGILDPRFYATINNRAFPEGSLNPIDFAPEIKHIPQLHFVGQRDVKVPPALFHSYDQAMGENLCSDMMLVDNATHTGGWVEQWKTLLAFPVTCNAPQKPVKVDTDMMDRISGGKKGSGAKR